MSEDEKRRRRDARTDAELADAIEKCWRTRFGTVPVVAEVKLAEIRRGG